MGMFHDRRVSPDILRKVMAENANQLVIQQLKQKATDLETNCDSDVIAFIGPLIPPTDNMIRDQIESLRENGKKTSTERKKLKFLVETYGGHMEPVRRIVDVLRYHYSVVDFVVPDFAFSAGTVLVMSGDAIYMDYYSVLGPIDPQIRQPDGTWGSAVGYLKKYEELVEKSKDNVITTAEMAFLLNKFDPMTLYSYEQEFKLGISLIEDWLPKYKFKNWTKTRTRQLKVTDKMRRKRAAEIGQNLSNPDLWHSHGRGIPMGKLVSKPLDIVIDDMSINQDFYEKVRTTMLEELKVFGIKSSSPAPIDPYGAKTARKSVICRFSA
ncbi:MAG: serine dehydrogenasease [candidate division Zixibacteria bacterium]|nr:serine dehydrogenasease [candidate division Zixibacteria bacterium]